MTETPRYLSLEEIDGDTFYGVKVGNLGEDGDQGTYAFTHDCRRAIAAAHALFRSTGDRAAEITITRAEWWRVVDNCGCGDTCPHQPDETEEVEHSCQHYGLPPCIDEIFTWMGLPAKPDDPDALPVIVMEVALW